MASLPSPLLLSFVASYEEGSHILSAYSYAKTEMRQHLAQCFEEKKMTESAQRRGGGSKFVVTGLWLYDNIQSLYHNVMTSSYDTPHLT